LQQPQAQGGEAKASADENQVTRPSARTAQSPPARDLTRHNGVNRRGASGDSRVTSNHRHAKSPGQSQQALEKALDPGPACLLGHGQGNQGITRRSPHRRNVAQGTSERPVSDGLRRMKAGCEVNAFNRHISGKNQFLPGVNFHQCSIIANAQTDARRSPPGPALDPGYELAFASEGRFVTHVVLDARVSLAGLIFGT
jgi:hypothetical protein